MKTNILQRSLVISVAVILIGCLKSPDATAPPPPRGYVSVMHLAPTAPFLDVFFNDTKVSNVPFAPGTTTGAYNAIDKGSFTIKFKKAASDSLVAELPLAQYDSLTYYTLFIYNLQANGPANAVRIRDDFSVLTSDKSYYRFFHASPNTGAVDLYIDNVKIQSGRSTADNTGNDAFNRFAATNPGNRTIVVKLAGTDTVVATMDDASLLQGNAYTFYLKGLTGGSGSSELSVGLLRAQ